MYGCSDLLVNLQPAHSHLSEWSSGCQQASRRESSSGRWLFWQTLGVKDPVSLPLLVLALSHLCVLPNCTCTLQVLLAYRHVWYHLCLHWGSLSFSKLRLVSYDEHGQTSEWMMELIERTSWNRIVMLSCQGNRCLTYCKCTCSHRHKSSKT